jgi:hypothetical protein
MGRGEFQGPVRLGDGEPRPVRWHLGERESQDRQDVARDSADGRVSEPRDEAAYSPMTLVPCLAAAVPSFALTAFTNCTNSFARSTICA